MMRTTRTIALLMLATGVSACSSRSALKARLGEQNPKTYLSYQSAPQASISLGGSR